MPWGTAGGRLESGRLKREVEPESWIFWRPRGDSMSPQKVTVTHMGPGTLACGQSPAYALAVTPSTDEEVVWDQHGDYRPVLRPVRPGSFLGALEQSHLLIS